LKGNNLEITWGIWLMNGANDRRSMATVEMDKLKKLKAENLTIPKI
jgi:hypothetical protein